MSGSIMFSLLHVSLNTGRTLNEVFSEGCVKWGNVRRSIGEGMSTLGLTLVILLSLTRVNLCIKNGSAIPKSSNKIFRFRDQKIARNADEVVCFKTTSKVYTITEEDLIIIHEKFFQKAINSKCGNLGKDIKLNLNAVTFKILGIKSKDTVLCLCFYLRFILNLVNFNLLYSSIKIQEDNRIHGGKINEEANASGNAEDTINYVFRGECMIRWPRDVHIGQKLNSRCLKEYFIKSKRYYSSVKDELKLKKIKRQFKNNNMPTWPDHKVLGLIRKKVFKQQLELVNIAEIYGLYSEEVFKSCSTLYFLK